MKKTLTALLICLILSACGNGKSKFEGGNEGANGGDSSAQNAAGLLSQVVEVVESSPDHFREVDLSKLKDVVLRVKIFVAEKTSANGYETDATNDGAGRIELNGSRWPALSQDRRRAILFHEVLGIMGLELGNYSISSRLPPLDTANTYTCEYRVIMPNTSVSIQNATSFYATAPTKSDAINLAMKACEDAVGARVSLPSWFQYCRSSMPDGGGMLKDSISCRIR